MSLIQRQRKQGDNAMGIKDKEEMREYSLELDRRIKCPHCRRVNDLKEILGNAKKRIDFNEKKEFRIRCMGCEGWFIPMPKRKPKEIVTEIYLFKSCSCGYNFDFRYPADRKRLFTTPILDVPYASCPQCGKTLIFLPEKEEWRFWLFLIWMKLKLLYLDIKDLFTNKRDN